LGEDFFKKYNVKLGFMSFFLKAATLALQEYPVVNSVIDGNEIVRRNYIDVSVAVATPTGLLVPVLRNCQNMKFHDYELGLANLAKKGKEGKISIEDMQGGTFTISNGGTFGSLMGTPIINPPQSAILGMHSIINRPVVRGDEIVARPMMYLALTYDHRLLDGKDAVLFLKRIQTHIENPKRMLL
jgi:2-oxoglutarate dehydrogenase E2 component (dihydrolipoamide succinyltransferase)